MIENIKINGMDAVLSLSESGLYRLTIPMTGMSITEKVSSNSDDMMTRNKIINRAKGLLKHWND